MSQFKGPTLGFASRADLVAHVREQEGPEALEGWTDQDVCDWFVAFFYGPQNFSPAFRRSIRDLLAGRRRPGGAGRFASQKNRTIFALPPSDFWPKHMHIPDEVCERHFLFVTNATADEWRSTAWRKHRTYLFYSDWAELRAAYVAARLMLAGADAADAMRRVRFAAVAEVYTAQCSIDAARQALEAGI